MRTLFTLFFLLVANTVLGEVNFTVRNTLLLMEQEDQKIRAEIIELGSNEVPQNLVDKAGLIDQRNTIELKGIIEKYRWPTKELIRLDGMSAVFLIIQHSPDHDFQESMLSNLANSYKNNEGISGQQLALLTDRVLLLKGKKQIYGTQFKVENNQIVFKPIENEEIVDNLRKKMKMPPLAFYKKLMEKAYGIKDHLDIELN